MTTRWISVAWRCCRLWFLACVFKKNITNCFLLLPDVHLSVQASENIPESTASAVFHLCLDFPFSLAFPSIHESAVAYLEQLNSESHGLYCRVSQAANTMEATCSFLKEVRAEVMLRRSTDRFGIIITGIPLPLLLQKIVLVPKSLSWGCSCRLFS